MSFLCLNSSRKASSSTLCGCYLSIQKVVFNVPYKGRFRLGTNMFSSRIWNSKPDDFARVNIGQNTREISIFNVSLELDLFRLSDKSVLQFFNSNS